MKTRRRRWDLSSVFVPRHEPHHPRCLVFEVSPTVDEGPQHFVWAWNSVLYTEYHRWGGRSVRRVFPSRRKWQKFWKEFEALGFWRRQAPIPMGARVFDALHWTISVGHGDRSVSLRPAEMGSWMNDGQIIGLLDAMRRLVGWRPAHRRRLAECLTWDLGPSTFFPHQESR